MSSNLYGEEVRKNARMLLRGSLLWVCGCCGSRGNYEGLVVVEVASGRTVVAGYESWSLLVFFFKFLFLQ